MIKIILTGFPGVGKTTAIQKINEFLKFKGIKTGGFITFEERENRKRVGFKIVNLATLEEDWLAHISLVEGPPLGKYKVNIKAIDNIGVNAVLWALKNADVILIDEVGPMEMKSQKFREIVKVVMTSDKPAILTLHRSYINMKLPELSTDKEVIMYQISQTNREAIPLIVSRELLKRMRL